MRKLFIVLGFAGFVLLASLIAYVECFTTRTPVFARKLTDVVPSGLAGWRVEDVPLAATAGALASVENILRSDDAVQRIFVNGNIRVLVYAAYWNPGKVTTTDAGAHNPDSCWVTAGWTRRERLYSQNGDISGRALVPFEYGVYRRGEMEEHVLFWHLVGGDPQRYEVQETGWRNGLAGRLERLPLVMEDFRRHGLNQKREQLFVRISSNLPLNSLKGNPRFAEVMNAVAGLGVFEDTSWAPKRSKN